MLQPVGLESFGLQLIKAVGTSWDCLSLGMQDLLSTELDLVRLAIVNAGYNYCQIYIPIIRGYPFISTQPRYCGIASSPGLWRSTSSLLTICRLALYPGVPFQAVPSHPPLTASCLDEYEDPDIQPPALNYGSFLKIALFILCVHTLMYAGAYVCSCLWMLEDSLAHYSSGTTHLSFGNRLLSLEWLDGYRALRIPG